MSIEPKIPLLTQIARLRFTRAHSVLASMGLHPSQYSLLLHLSGTSGINQRELARQLFIKPATLTAALRRLEKGGLIEKQLDSSDKRVFRIAISALGKEKLAIANQKIALLEAQIFQDFSPQERTNFEQLARRIRDNLLAMAKDEASKCL
ncbi:MAG: MarR family transcriptional regulator [Sphaerochaetaceae bacterium]